MRLTAGGIVVNYKGDPSITVGSVETIKIHWNYVSTTLGAKHCTADRKDFFLMADLEEHECLRIHVSLIPETFIKKHKLDEVVDKDSNVYAEVHRGMCGFPQVGMLEHEDLVKRLTAHGYEPKPFAPGL